MKINRNNYEIFFIDYLDGHLNDKDIYELMVFLSQNSDLKEELDDINGAVLVPEDLSFPEKENLKKTCGDKLLINENNFEEFCVSEIEGNLTKPEISQLETYLKKHPEKEKEYNLFHKTILKSEFSIKYKDKELLKKISINNLSIISENNFDEFCVAFIEEDLTSEQEKLFSIYLKEHPEKKKEFELFEKLVPDKNIVFEKKASIKKYFISKPKTKTILSYASAAAVILIFMLVYFYNGEQILPENVKFAQKSDNIENLPSAMHENNTPINAENNLEKPILANNNNDKKKKSSFPDSNQKKEKIEFRKEEKLQSINKNTDYQIKILEQNLIADMKYRNVENVSITPLEETIADKYTEEKNSNTDEYLTLSQLFYNKLSSQVFNKDNTETNKITIWDLAETGVKGLSKLTGRKMELKRIHENKTEMLAFNSKNFDFSTKK
ncbi:MAG: hypothetical protein KAT68_16850 [Bacteroidales bacterium]|nr:hypothetical protein [Bacteroidales bacterium]